MNAVLQWAWHNELNKLASRMAHRIKGRPPGLDQLEYDMFWDEARSIEETCDISQEEEEEQMGGTHSLSISVTDPLSLRVWHCMVFVLLDLV